MTRLPAVLCLVLAACGSGPALRAPFFPGSTPVPAAGPEFEGVAAWDAPVVAFMRRWDLPGATLAVTQGGRLVVARGYGYADYAARTPMAPTSLLRIASLSKPLTAVAVLRLAAEGRLDLDQPISTWLTLPPGADARLADATVRHLLEHAGGWDRSGSGDPVARLPAVAAALGVAGPVSAPQLASYALTLALDAAPGAHYAYSNLGYVVLGRILEQASSLPYAEQVRRSVCAPAGMAAMSIAGTRPADRVAGEAVYYDSASAPLMTSVLPGEGQVPRPYGWTHLAAIDAAGGWMGSAVDLARFVTALDGSRGGPLLAAPWLDEMMARPDLPEWAGAASWFGLGMQVQPTSAGPIWHHGGSMPGTSAELLRAPGGWAIALLFNTRPDDAEVGRFEQELVDLAWTMASAPAPASPDDLFPLFP